MRILNIYIFIIGLCNGSFIYCLVDHYLKGQLLLETRSKCDHCGHKLNIIDLIPVLSFLLLKGRCRYCKRKISINYPLIELICGIVYMLIFNQYGLNIETIIYLLLFSLLFSIALIDLRSYEIPFVLIVLCLVLGIVINIIDKQYLNFISGLIISLYVYLISLIMKKILNKECLGFGDIELIFIFGLFIGLYKTIWCLLLSCVLGIIMIIINKKEMIPFGPSLSLSFMIILLLSDKLII